MDISLIISESLTHLILWSCALVYLSWYKRLDRPFKLMAITSFIDVICVSVSTYLLVTKTNNWPINHFVSHAEFILLGASFYFIFIDNRFKKGVIVMGCIYLVFSIFDTIYLEPFHMAPGNIRVLGNIFCMLCAFGLFYQIFREGKSLYIEREPYFWLGASVLTYFGASMFISLFHNYLVYDLPLWMYEFFFYVDLFLFFLSKVALLYGAYLMTRKDRSELNNASTMKLINQTA